MADGLTFRGQYFSPFLNDTMASLPVIKFLSIPTDGDKSGPSNSFRALYILLINMFSFISLSLFLLNARL
jgi:hypothetical protein